MCNPICFRLLFQRDHPQPRFGQRQINHRAGTAKPIGWAAAAPAARLPGRRGRNSARNSRRVRVALRGPATRLPVVKPPAFGTLDRPLGALGIVNPEPDAVD